MEKVPFLSILVPVYNTAPSLRTCIESIISQSFDDWELILVDDGSTDESLEICEAYAKRYENIFVIHKENGGLVSARKTGMERARGVYVTYVDSDDWIERDGYKNLFEIAAKTNADVIAAPLCMHRQGKTRMLENMMPAGLYADKESLKDLKKSLMFKETLGRFGIIPSLCGKWFRKDHVYKYQMNLREEVIFGEDASVSFPALWSAGKIYLSPEAYYQYEVREGSITTAYSAQRYGRIGILLDYMNSVKNLLPEIPPDFEKQLARYQLYLMAGAFESELSFSNWERLCKSCRRITGEMKKTKLESFQKAAWRELHMDCCTKYMMRFWEDGHYRVSFLFVALEKVGKKIKFGRKK